MTMSLTLRSSSNLFNENERLRRKRLTTTTLNRFLSFNENKSSAVENRRRLLQKSTPNLIELLEEDDDDIDDNQALCHECDTCSKIFVSEYGLNYHINMYHPNQSILCSICHITFRSHRSLKTHQQRRHSNQQTKYLTNQNSLSNYSYLSSYLVLAFSSQQFPILAKIACEQQRLPLGDFSSKIFKCSSCSISFPCQRTLTYHVLDQHEQYQYKICQETISNLIEQIEYQQRTVTNDIDDDIESIRFNLSQQASHFGLVNKQLNQQIQMYKTQQNQSIYPTCQHEKRTCANLCLKYLSKYEQLVRNYSYQIPIIPKGSAFSQGSIVSVPSINTLFSFKTNESHDSPTNGRQKRKSFKQTDESTVQTKRKSLSNVTTNSRPTRTHNGKQQIEQTIKVDDHIRSSSISSNSSTSTRSLTSQRSSKRSLSPSIPNPPENIVRRRRRTRDQHSKIVSSSAVIRIGDELDIEQENGDDDEDNGEDHGVDGDILPIKLEQSKSQHSSKQRQASSGSIEYVQTLSNDQQLNNIENFKSKSTGNDEEIIICRSPPSTKKVLPTTNKTHSKTPVNGAKKSNGQQSPPNDEHVRVRCKICGEILEGRSRFSKHVIAMHPNLLKKNLPDSKPHPTAIVR